MGRHLAAVVGLAVVLGPAVLALAAWPPALEAALPDAGLIYVATLRRDGTRSTAAPVWFAEMDGAIWINTGASSHKVRRIRRGSPILVAPKEGGPFVEAAADIVTDGPTAERLGQLYAKKYWIAWMGMFRPRASRVTSGKTVLIRVARP